MYQKCNIFIYIIFSKTKSAFLGGTHHIWKDFFFFRSPFPTENLDPPSQLKNPGEVLKFAFDKDEWLRKFAWQECVTTKLWIMGHSFSFAENS